MLNRFKEGDTAFYGTKEYVVLGYDEINEEVLLEAVEDDEELAADESLLLTPDQFAQFQESDNAYEAEEEFEDDDEEDFDDEPVSEDVDDEEFEDDDEEDFDDEPVSEDVDDEEIEDLDEMTKAAASVKMKPSAATSSSKAMMISNTISALANMNSGDAIEFYNKMMAQYGKGKDHGAPNAAAKNKASVEMKKVAKEDLEVILHGQETLSEEVQDKIATLFESAVHLRVVEQVKQIQERMEEQLEERVAEIEEQLEEQVDQYLSYAAKEWMKENEVAIHNNLKTEITENFMIGLKNLFMENYIDVPEESIDIVEALAERVDELENELNEQVHSNIEMTEALTEFAAEDVFSEVAEGLAMTQVEKLRTLAEGIDFDGDIDSYRTKLETIKEANFKVRTPDSTLNEEVELDDVEDTERNTRISDPTVANYAQAISRTIKR